MEQRNELEALTEQLANGDIDVETYTKKVAELTDSAAEAEAEPSAAMQQVRSAARRARAL